jgi:iron(III) transport system ATP-binding protein
MSFLDLDNLSFSYDGKKIIDNFSATLKEGEIHCLLGPSGCGKSTLLHMIAGFLRPLSGQITLNDELLFNQNMFTPPEKRSIGVIFQEHCLFSHMTINENIKYGINDSFSKREKHSLVMEMLKLVDLESKSEMFPNELSGGEQQRIAIARTFANSPKLILMDEPFSGLDMVLRKKLRREIRGIFKKTGKTCILVTHSQEEAFEFGDKVTVFSGDKNHYQTGEMINLLQSPSSIDIGQFLDRGIFYIKDNHKFIPYSLLEFSLNKGKVKATVENIYSSMDGDVYEFSSQDVYSHKFDLNSSLIQRDIIQHPLELNIRDELFLNF